MFPNGEARLPLQGSGLNWDAYSLGRDVTHEASELQFLLPEYEIRRRAHFGGE